MQYVFKHMAHIHHIQPFKIANRSFTSTSHSCRQRSSRVVLLPSSQASMRAHRWQWLLQYLQSQSTTMAFTDLKRFIYETGRTQAILQCGDENAIKAVRRVAMQDIGVLTGRLAPTGSSQSQGSVERWRQTGFSQVRALCLALVSRLHLQLTDLPVTHPFMPWRAKHATWLFNR